MSQALRCSVVMCTYNGERHLGEQLESIVSQDQPPDEIVIRDDASTDGTRAIVERFASSYPGVVVAEFSPNNGGVLANFEQAIGMASGDVIFLADQDDLWERHKVAAFMDVFARDPHVGLVFSDAELIDDDGAALGQRAWQTPLVAFTASRRAAWETDGRAFQDQLEGNVVTGATLAFRAVYRPLVVPFPAALGRWHIHDGWTALVISAVARVVPVEHPYTRYRIHGAQAQGLYLGGPLPGIIESRRSSHEVRGCIEAGLSAVLERLAEHREEFPPVHADLDTVEERVRHLRARLIMPSSTPGERLRCIASELRHGRYHRHSSGTKSALLDAVSPRAWRRPA